MSYTINFIFKKDHLHARIKGENTAENILHYLRDINDACKQHACTRVLIEENLTGPSIGTLDIFRIVNQASQNTSPVIHKIAYVDVNPEHDFKGMQFAETVAQNRGVYIRLFREVKSAEEWLGEKK